MKRVHGYRIWFPQGSVSSGADFNQLCETCQDKIDEFIREGVGIPMRVVAVDTSSVNATLYLGSYLKGVELCPECTKALKEWIDAQEHFAFGSKMLQLWRSRKEEEAKE